MSARTQATEFLAASRDYLDGKTNADQAASALSNQLHGMLADGSWKDAMREMKRQGDPNGWHFTPVVNCRGDESISTCDISAPGLDIWAKGNRQITFTDHMHDSVNLQVGHTDKNTKAFVADRTVNDPVLRALPRTLPFSDNLSRLNEDAYAPIQGFPAGHFSAIFDTADMDRLALKSPAERAAVKNLYFNGGDDIDGVALHTARRLPNVEHLLLNSSVFDKDLQNLPHMQKLDTVIFTSASRTISSEGLKSLSQIPHLRRLDLAATNIRGDELKALTSPTLRELHLGSKTTDESFKYLAQLRNLETLQVTFGDFTADGVKQLAASRSLKHLVLQYPLQISAARVEELRRALPGVQIDFLPAA